MSGKIIVVAPLQPDVPLRLRLKKVRDVFCTQPVFDADRKRRRPANPSKRRECTEPVRKRHHVTTRQTVIWCALTRATNLQRRCGQGFLDFELGRGRFWHPTHVIRSDLTDDRIERARQNQRDDHDADPKRRSAHEPTNRRCSRRTRIVPRRTLDPLGPMTSHMPICRLKRASATHPITSPRQPISHKSGRASPSENRIDCGLRAAYRGCLGS